MNKGFSLVELIVVIAIMAILVGVAVPVYTSYITKAEQATDIQAIDNLEHACKIVGIEYSTTITFTGDTNAESIVAVVGDDDAYAQLKLILADSIGKTITADDENNKLTLALETKVDGTDVKCPANIG